MKYALDTLGLCEAEARQRWQEYKERPDIDRSGAVYVVLDRGGG